METQVDYGEQPMQMDDYGQVPEPHHCGEDVNEEGGQDETETDQDS